jgi:hypothetical protein
MTQGQNPYQLYFGTLGGYLMIYDVRYNLISSQLKHFMRAPISSISTFSPNPYLGNLSLNRSDTSSPLLLVATGNSQYELSLVNLETASVEVLLTVDDRASKESLVSGLPTVPSYYRESVFYDTSKSIRKNETNNSLFRRYLQTHTNTKYFEKLVSYQQQALIRNLDEDWLKSSNNRFKLVKSAYESGNSCRKVLVPRLNNGT